ncbi:MAG: hypothetical protein AAGK02_04940 [Pseudomonadota bacterium]
MAAPVLAVSAVAAEPKQSDETEAEAEANTKNEAEKDDKPEAKKICRRIRVDASSRRPSKVCLTTEEWREFNNRR